MKIAKLGVRKDGLVVKLIAATWLVLGIVLVVGTVVSLSLSRMSMDERAQAFMARQQEIFEAQIQESSERQRIRLEPVLALLSGLSKKPLLSRSWSGTEVQLPSNEQFVQNLQACFQRREKDLRFQCLSRDVELRVQANILASNQYFLEESIQQLLSDPEITGILVLDIDENPYLGFKRGYDGKIARALSQGEFDALDFRLEEVVRIEGDPFGKVILYYSQKFVQEARAKMESEHAQTLGTMRTQNNQEILALTQSRLWEGLALVLAAAISVTWVLVRTALIPLNALRSGAEMLALGNFDAPIDVSRRDEFGDLARSFSHMRQAILHRIESLEKLNVFGRRILGLHSTQAIFEACESFIDNHYGNSTCHFYLKDMAGESALQAALTLPARFQWSALPTSQSEVAGKVFLERTGMMERGGDDAFFCVVPFEIRGEVYGVLSVRVNGGEPSSEHMTFCGTVSHLASVTIENLVMVEEARIKVRMEAALNAAEAVQSAIISKLKSFPNTQFAAHYSAAEKGMGDWYGQYFDAKRRRLYFYIADVTGHGIAAALLTSMLAGAVSTTHDLLERNFLELGTEVDLASHMQLVLTAVNDMVRRTGESVEKSLTLLAFCLEVDTGKYFLANCAHPQPFLVSKSDVKSVLASGVPLGLRAEPSYEAVEGKLMPGDRMVFFTDGLLENEGHDGKIFRRMALKRNLEQFVLSPKDVIDSILNEAKSTWGDVPPADDVSIVVMDWRA